MATYSEKNGVTLIDGASDPEGDPVFVSHVNGLAANVGQPVPLEGGGTVTVAADGTVALDDATLANPAEGAVAIAGLFTYRLSDGISESPDYTATVEVSGFVAPGLPAAFGAADWTLSDAGTGDALSVGILALPDDGGDPLTGIEAELDGGVWTPLGAAAPGSYTIPGLTGDQPVQVRLRAVNGIGGGPASDAKTATPTTVAGSGAVFTGGALSGTISLSGLAPSGGTTDVEWRLCPAAGDVTAQLWPSLPATGGVDGFVPVAALGTPIPVSYIPLPGPYVVHTREWAGASPGPWAAASAPGTVTDTAAALAKPWYAEVAALIGHGALGTTVGRTATAPLTLIDAGLMSATEINAALPPGWSFNAGNVTLSAPSGASAANPAVLENYEIRGMKMNITAGQDHIHVRQCLIYPTAYSGAPFILVFRGGRLRDFSHNTVIGPRRFGGTGQVAQCQYPVSSPGQGRGIIDHISWNLCSGMSGDCFSTTGSPVTRADGPDGCWIHHNVLDAVAWVTGFSGSGNWHDTSNAPHGDLITVKGSYDNGTFIEDNVFWHVPVEPVTIPASVAHDGIARIAGAARPFAGSRGNPLGDIGHSSQNNVCRIVTDNLQIVDATTWAGPVRVTRFIHNRWAGMAGLPWDLNSSARAAGNTAIWDGISGASDPSQSYDAAAFANTERTQAAGYFLSDPTYSGNIVNCWTGAAVGGIGAPSNLASPL